MDERVVNKMAKEYYGGTFSGNPGAFIEVGKDKALDADLDKLVSMNYNQINLSNLEGIADDLKFSVGDTITDGQKIYFLDKDLQWHQIHSGSRTNRYAETDRATYRLSRADVKKLIEK